MKLNNRRVTNIWVAAAAAWQLIEAKWKRRSAVL